MIGLVDDSIRIQGVALNKNKEDKFMTVICEKKTSLEEMLDVFGCAATASNRNCALICIAA